MTSTTRRDFLTASAALAASASLAHAQSNSPIATPSGPDPAVHDPVPDLPTPESTRKGDMLYRKLGNTGETVSLVGLGGAHIGGPAEDTAIKIVRRAIDSGITFMDNCWDYYDGDCELRMGKALKDGYRKKVFLMTKVDGRTKDAAAKQLDESLKRLQTDVIDLWQFHENIRMDDPDRFFAKGGAVEAFQDAKKAGKIRFIGFTGHKDPAVHLRMLAVAKQHNFHFDTCQMPLNVMDAHFRSFAHLVVPELLNVGTAPLAMKTLGGGILLRSNTLSATQCIQYAMNLPVATVICGIDSDKILDQALAAAQSFQPMTKDQVAALLAKTKDAAAQGAFELFKTSDRFDGTARNPKWMGLAS